MPQKVLRIAGTIGALGDTGLQLYQTSPDEHPLSSWSDPRRCRLREKEARWQWSYRAMTKSFLINTSVAAIVSAFVFTAGVPSAHAWGDNDKYGHASQSQWDKGRSYGAQPPKRYGTYYRKHYSTHYPKRYSTHYQKRYSHNPYDSYGMFGSYGTQYPKRYWHNPYDSYGFFGGYGTRYPKRYWHNPYDSYGSYSTHYPKRYSTHYSKHYGTHYQKRYWRNPYDSYGMFGSYGTRYPKRYWHNPYDSYGIFRG
jgi:hypothetical protein